MFVKCTQKKALSFRGIVVKNRQKQTFAKLEKPFCINFFISIIRFRYVCCMNALLRTSKILKYLALIIFCIEFLTPVFFFSTPEESGEEYSNAHFQDHKQASVSLASLFTEETTNEEERESGRSKDQLVDYDFQFAFSSLQQVEAALNILPFITQNELHRVTPPLYQLHCLLLI